MSDQVIVGVIGDVVGSRRADDRAALQQRLTHALAEVDRAVPSLDPFAITLGDEFQGTFTRIEHAAAATLLVQLVLGADQVRFGVGAGERTVYDPERVPLGQDGPVWWAARAAIKQAGVSASGIGTGFAHHEATTRHPPATIETMTSLHVMTSAMLQTRDALVAQLDRRDCDIVLGLIKRASQTSIGASLGISQPAVSQRISRLHLDALAANFHTLVATS